MAKISVIIPVHNVEKYIDKCLGSIVSQTYKNLEIICIDDQSSDNSLKILTDFAQKDSRIKLIRQDHKGVSVARNNGLKIATGEYISFIDSDDWIEPKYFENLHNAITQTDSDIACSSVLREKKCKSLYRISYTEQKVFSTLEDKIKACDIPNCCYVWNKLYKAELVKTRKFKEGVIFEDVLYLPEVIKSAKQIVTVPTAIYHYRQNSGSIIRSKNTPEKIREAYNSKKYIIEFFKENNLNLPKEEQNITKQVKYFCGVPLIKTKEYNGKEENYLFGFIKL